MFTYAISEVLVYFSVKKKFIVFKNTCLERSINLYSYLLFIMDAYEATSEVKTVVGILIKLFSWDQTDIRSYHVSNIKCQPRFRHHEVYDDLAPPLRVRPVSSTSYSVDVGREGINAG